MTAKTENGQVTLTTEQLEGLLQQAREAAIQAVATMTTPVKDAEPRKQRMVNLTNAKKVGESLDSDALRYIRGDDPNGPISYRQRKRVLAVAEKGALQWSDLDPWTTGQAVAAIQVLENGDAIKVGPLEVFPR